VDRDTRRRKVSVISLPHVGLHGNSHMMMQDRNNLQVADVLIDSTSSTWTSEVEGKATRRSRPARGGALWAR